MIPFLTMAEADVSFLVFLFVLMNKKNVSVERPPLPRIPVCLIVALPVLIQQLLLSCCGTVTPALIRFHMSFKVKSNV